MLLLSGLLISTVVLTPSQGAVYTVGVKPDDWADHTETFSNVDLSLNDSATIISVSGTLVTINFTTYNTQGRFDSVNLTGDLATSSGFISLDGWLIPANLAKGDPIGPGSIFVINNTLPISAAGMQRTCNHLSFRETALGTNISIDLYWDQETGMLVQESLKMGAELITCSMTSTDLWPINLGVAELALVMGSVVVVALAAVIAIAADRSRRVGAAQ